MTVWISPWCFACCNSYALADGWAQQSWEGGGSVIDIDVEYSAYSFGSAVYALTLSSLFLRVQQRKQPLRF